MTEEYFEIVDSTHFWVVRRFEVLQQLAGHLLQPNRSYCEIGCGNGILQRQLEITLDLKVDGFDLCLTALQRNMATTGTLYYYDVFERDAALGEKYDGLFLFDVLEHIQDDTAFLKECLFYLKPDGRLFINVPARSELFSQYDTIAGHVRRYTMGDLKTLARACGLEVEAATYWGLPLYPVLLLRRLVMACSRKSVAYNRGFTPPHPLINRLLRICSRFEVVPQQILGTSIEAVLRKPK